MKTAVVFGPINSLDFSDIRYNTLRIPEVSLKIREAQDIWDQSCEGSFSFHHFLNSDDPTFFNNISLKSLALTLVQLGLFDRYVRRFGEPDVLVGNIQDDAALKVASKMGDLNALISTSPACQLVRPMVPLQLAVDTKLMGQALPKYQAHRMPTQNSPAEPLGNVELSMEKILQYVVEKEGVTKIVYVGPGLMHEAKCFSNLEMQDVQIAESIDVDPMLSWFWTEFRQFSQSLAWQNA